MEIVNPPFFMLKINRLTSRFDYGMEPVAWGYDPEFLIEWPKKWRVHPFYDTAYRVTRFYDPKSILFDYGLHYEVVSMLSLDEFTALCRRGQESQDQAREIYLSGFLKLQPALGA
jgi:hypothetical protein